MEAKYGMTIVFSTAMCLFRAWTRYFNLQSIPAENMLITINHDY